MLSTNLINEHENIPAKHSTRFVRYPSKEVYLETSSYIRLEHSQREDEPSKHNFPPPSPLKQSVLHLSSNMKYLSSLLLSSLASQALACVHFQGGIQQGGINHGMWVNKFDDNGRQPCKGQINKDGDGWFRVGCEGNTVLRVSPDGKKVQYSYGNNQFAWNQDVKSSRAEHFGACDDRRGACVGVGTEYDWDVKMYC